MDTENFSPQIPTQPTSSAYLLKATIILGIILFVLIVVGVALNFNNLKQINKKQVTIKYSTVIFSDLSAGKDEIIFYSVNFDTKKQKQLFSIPIDKLGFGLGATEENKDIKFCAATNKIYIRTTKSIKGAFNPALDTPMSFFLAKSYLYITEIDLKGNIRELDFTKVESSDNLLPIDTGFILSNDCQKIIWSTRKIGRFQETGEAVNEIVYSDLNGGGKKVLNTARNKIIETSRDRDTALVKVPMSWSTDPNVVYLTNLDLLRGLSDHSGGLFKVVLNINLISEINTIPTQNKIIDISDNENYIAHYYHDDDHGGLYITNLTDMSNMYFKDVSAGKLLKFSMDNSKVAYNGSEDIQKKEGTYIAPVLSVAYLSDLLKTKKIIAHNVWLKDWLSNDSVIGVREDSGELVLLNINDAKETKLASFSDSSIYIGISDK